ncbi:MAG: transposase [Ghiorsea sp.]|nr:transposase [Ghiorsea sp.]
MLWLLACFARNALNLGEGIDHANDVSLPVAFELITKPIRFSVVKTRKEKKRSDVTKNELLRSMISSCQKNQLKWRYILADSWFSSSENMTFVHKKVKKYFIFALKSNRLVALSLKDKKQGKFVRIDKLEWSEEPVQGWVKGQDFPVLLHRQVFTNKDDSIGILYLITNDLNLTKETLETTYKKRWKA